ncbi:unnamed protein product [Caenorhabditis sp. 36 PRJEB53466]|nr:unnamed protein product [Caenorhabditis sp. 36 PRJEB53466]
MASLDVAFFNDMDPIISTQFCAETHQTVVIVKSAQNDGALKTQKFSFNAAKNVFEVMKTAVCANSDDLTARHIAWCPHLKSTFIFAFNHVEREDLQYIYDANAGKLVEVRCEVCKRDENREDAKEKEILFITTSPECRRVVVLSVSDGKRIVRLLYDDRKKVHHKMELTEVVALPKKKVEEKRGCSDGKIDTSKRTFQESVKTSPLELDVSDKFEILDTKLKPVYIRHFPEFGDIAILFAIKPCGLSGMFVFDRLRHQFIEIYHQKHYKELVGLSRSTYPQLFFITESLKTKRLVNIMKTREGLLEKKQFTSAGLFETLPPMPVVQDRHIVTGYLKDVRQTGAMEDRASHLFYKTIEPFVICERPPPEVTATLELTHDPEDELNMIADEGLSERDVCQLHEALHPELYDQAEKPVDETDEKEEEEASDSESESGSDSDSDTSSDESTSSDASFDRLPDAEEAK